MGVIAKVQGIVIVNKSHCLLLDPPIEFGRQSSYYTRTPASFANIFRYHLSFSKKFFRPKATDWWNDLPMTLISGSATKFSRELYIIIYCIFDCLFVFVHCLCCI